MCELLWSDPQPEPGRSPSKRGVGVGFGQLLLAPATALWTAAHLPALCPLAQPPGLPGAAVAQQLCATVTRLFQPQPRNAHLLPKMV